MTPVKKKGRPAKKVATKKSPKKTEKETEDEDSEISEESAPEKVIWLKKKRSIEFWVNKFKS